MNEPLVPQVAAVIFVLALVHTFSASWFQRLSQRPGPHAGLWHLLGEVEVAFGWWAMVLMIVVFFDRGKQAAVGYLEHCSFTEPLFVFTVMVIASSRPIVEAARFGLTALTARLPVAPWLSQPFIALSLAPLLGSLITEPAAMTLAALLLREQLFTAATSRRLRYATLAVLFVNISVGGTLTPYAAPPILMVAATWHWNLSYMLSHFASKAVGTVLVNATGLVTLFRRELRSLPDIAPAPTGTPLAPRPPWSVTLVHLAFLGGVVVFAHHPPMFLGLLLFFLGFTAAYERHQSPLMLRESLLVAFFLAGLVVVGGLQAWWLQPLLTRMSADTVFPLATALTAFTDNAALTYLGSLVGGLTPQFQYHLVAGALTGGGLTLIANAPNPAGASLVRGGFENGTISAWPLLIAALGPTAVAFVMFRWV